MSECAVEGCKQDGTETIEVIAEHAVYQPQRYVMDKLHLNVPVCPGHREYLSRGFYTSLSVAE